MKKKIVVGIIAVAAPLGGLLLLTRSLWPTNVAETAPNHAEEALRTRRYRTELKPFADEAQKIVPQLSSWGKNWTLVGAETGENAAVVKAEVPVVVFTDDLMIKAEKDAATGETIVNVRSNSRVGKSDFGENRRHVLMILEAFDEKFGNN